MFNKNSDKLSLTALGDATHDPDFVSHRIKPSDNPNSNIYVMFSCCRSGSSSALEMVSRAGIPSYYQPVKDIIRFGDYTFNIPSSDKVFIKETFGPLRVYECTYDPVDILVSAGVPIERIKPIGLFRHPYFVFSSWKGFFDSADFLSFIVSYLHSYELYKSYQRRGLNPHVLVYETLRGNAEAVTKALCEYMGVEYRNELVHWGEKPEAGVTSEVVLSDKMRAPFNKTVVGKDFEYKSRDLSNLSAAEIEDIDKHLRHLYEEVSKDCTIPAMV